jgi:hypothetical protein
MQKRRRAQKALSEPKNRGLEPFLFLLSGVYLFLFSYTCASLLAEKMHTPRGGYPRGAYLCPVFGAN